jgi:hypothetical protein
VAGATLVGNSQTEIKSSAVSEPGTLGILGAGLVGTWYALRRRNKKQDQDHNRYAIA